VISITTTGLVFTNWAIELHVDRIPGNRLKCKKGDFQLSPLTWSPTISRREQIIMREVFADFARLGERPDLSLGLAIPLGREDYSPALDELKDGERLMLVMPGELYAPGIARSIDSQGKRYWFGVIESRTAIHELAPDQAGPAL
jgi:hypothetical protein